MSKQAEIVFVLRANAAEAKSLTTKTLSARVGGDVVGALQDIGAIAKPLFPHIQSRDLVESPTSEALTRIVEDQARYYSVEVADALAAAVVERLQTLSEVETAYIKPAVENPLAPLSDGLAEPPEYFASTIPNFVEWQRYLLPSPAGVDAVFAWELPGGRGDDIRVIDIEGAWQFSHIDLLQNSGGIVGGTPLNDQSWRDHGTAVLGVIGGDDNGFGICGIAPNATLGAISHEGTHTSQAIQAAAQRLRPGDILLLEMHRPGPRWAYQPRQDQKGYIPIEWWPDDFLAIRFALSKGIVVVEAAGNGGENLDDGLYGQRPPNFPANWENPFRAAAQPGMAVMVGAGAPPTGTYGADRSRLDFSNFGTRVDCQGWGRDVVTTGYGNFFKNSSSPFDENYWYTSTFSGTSSASPIVTGAIACLQGIAKQRARLLTNDQIRNAFRLHGAQQTGNIAERIGPRPNLRELVSIL